MLYKEDLDKMTCAMGHQTNALWLHSSCHLKQSTWIRYKNGILTITCATCNKIITQIAVAPRQKPGA